MEEKNTPLTDEQKMRRRVARTIGRNIWRSEYKGANPEATKEQINAAWQGARKTATKSGMRAVRALEREGFVVTATDKVKRRGQAEKEEA